MSSSNNTVKIHATIAIAEPAAASVYYFARLQDINGCGWVSFSKETAMAQLSCTWNTFKRRSKKAVTEGFFHKVEFKNNRGYIKYKSIASVKAQYAAEGCHTSGVSTGEELRDLFSLKLYVYKLSLFAQQERCEKEILKTVKSNKMVYDPVLGGSHVRNGCIHVEGDTHFVKRTKQAIGASQITVALKLKRSRRTLVKYASFIPHVHIYKQVTVNEKTTSYPGHFVFTYLKLKTGKFRKTCFRRRPNYYFVDMEAKKEQSPKVVAPHIQLHDKKQQKQADFEYLRSVKKARRVSFQDKLIDLSHAKLIELAEAVLWHWKRIQSPIIAQQSQGDLISIMDKTYKDFDNDNKLMLDLMLRRTKRGMRPLPNLLEQGQIDPSCYTRRP